MNPTRQRFGSLAKVYTKDGRSIRVPLRPNQTVNGSNHNQSPERQFMRWFTWQSSANPGFPAMVKNVLLVVSDETNCPDCQQSLKRFLQRFRLIGKLQVRNATPKLAYKNTCGCQHASGFNDELEAETPVQTELDQLLAGDTQKFENEFEQEFTPNDVIHPNIDVHAQYAIQRMLKSYDLDEWADGNEMLAAVKAGLLRGIYKEDQQVPALYARRIGLSWWQLIKPGEDAALRFSLSPENKILDMMIVFRDSVRSNPQRLDPALRQKWQLAKRILVLQKTVSAAAFWGALNKMLGMDVLSGQNSGKVAL